MNFDGVSLTILPSFEMKKVLKYNIIGPQDSINIVLNFKIPNSQIQRKQHFK